ncbi:16S rRNA (guanine(527)-N(7))-methyltransferase RsmG [Thiorhodococcus mannitoliphagus]|uniref:Ribosomal RNA small subunit methyltransferase G n=1 Tax=Thiorhodococcus mannitoliphagus TaxID=329406 RepID=A0A6P1DXA9_9GAMM|nr:16S rRNA (guanine(527)-N(7))-methyltransferase RsmG [Thiorhodococcus mannitoliphagus]NEX21356.1 16S rRNA (guanine(527)-N(7))-methyltransferase RsmG [Thiorhodococcus mannitoliphagus]
MTASEAQDDARLAERLSVGSRDLGLALTAGQQAALLHYLALMVRWNRAYNLTAVRDPLEMVVKHLLDSLAIQPFLFGATVLDIGTGAGLPGIPLAIVNPARRFHLLDSNGKKVRFVRQVVLELGLANVEPAQSRMETYLPQGKFSTIVSRAVAAGEILRAPTAHWLARPGRLLLMKGRQTDDAFDVSGFAAAAPRVHPLRVPFLDETRHLIEIRSD